MSEFNPWKNQGWPEPNPHIGDPWSKYPPAKKKDPVPPFKPSGVDAWSIGFDEMWNLLESLNKRTAYKSSYPPYNIVKADEDHYTIEVAVAGFSKADITLVKEGNLLTVNGSKDPNSATYLHQGIAGRTFKQEFALADHIEVVSAELVDGVLRVNLERQIPDDKKPVYIELV